LATASYFFPSQLSKDADKPVSSTGIETISDSSNKNWKFSGILDNILPLFLTQKVNNIVFYFSRKFDIS